MLARVAFEYLTGFYSTISVDSSIRLVREDGVVLAHYPARRASAEEISSSLIAGIRGSELVRRDPPSSAEAAPARAAPGAELSAAHRAGATDVQRVERMAAPGALQLRAHADPCGPGRRLLVVLRRVLRRRDRLEEERRAARARSARQPEGRGGGLSRRVDGARFQQRARRDRRLRGSGADAGRTRRARHRNHRRPARRERARQAARATRAHLRSASQRGARRARDRADRDRSADAASSRPAAIDHDTAACSRARRPDQRRCDGSASGRHEPVHQRRPRDARRRAAAKCASKPCRSTAARTLTLGALQPGRWIRLSIADTGIGLSPEQLQSIFDPFYTSRASGEGSGIGLTVVRNIVSDMQRRDRGRRAGRDRARR